MPRVEKEFQRWLVGEGAIGFFRPLEQSGRRTRYMIPEAQLQIQLPLGIVRPSFGGGGWVAAQGRSLAGTTSVAAGLRIAIPNTRIDTRAELRVRGIGRGFTGSTAEWTLGAAYRF